VDRQARSSARGRSPGPPHRISAQTIRHVGRSAPPAPPAARSPDPRDRRDERQRRARLPRGAARLGWTFTCFPRRMFGSPRAPAGPVDVRALDHVRGLDGAPPEGSAPSCDVHTGGRRTRTSSGGARREAAEERQGAPHQAVRRRAPVARITPGSTSTRSTQNLASHTKPAGIMVADAREPPAQGGGKPPRG
jgi:hypothetical protein